MRHALLMVVDIPVMLAPQVTIIGCFEISTMLTPQKIVSNAPHSKYQNEEFQT